MIFYKRTPFINASYGLTKGLVLLTLFCVSCREPLGYGVSLYFMPEDCQEMHIHGNIKDQTISIELDVKGETIPRDNEIERIITNYYIEGGRCCAGSVLRAIRYKQDVCRGLTITSNDLVFGLSPGSDLTDYFYIQSDSFLITAEKRLVYHNWENMTIQEFLSYNPLVVPKMSIVSSRRYNKDSLTVKVTLLLENGQFLENTLTIPERVD